MVEQHRVALGLVPFGAQIEALNSPERFVFVGGGWGSSKTVWLVLEMLRCVAENPGLPSMAVSPSYRLQRRTVFSTIVDVLRPTGAKRWPSGTDSASVTLGPMVKDWSAADLCLTWWNDHRTYFASADVPGSLEGVNLCAVFIDEGRLIRRSAWEIASARVRLPASRCRRRCVASVPEMGWLWDEFGRGVPGRKYIRARTRDNPHLPADYADDIAASLSPQMARAYLDGEFVVMEGRVFWTYDATSASAGGSLLPVRTSPDRPSYGALDFGGRSPWFGLIQDVPVHDQAGGVVVSLGSGDRVVDCVTDEVVGSDTLSQRHAQAIAAVCKDRGVRLQAVYCDPAGRARNSQTGLRDVQVYTHELKAAGVLIGGLDYPRSLLDRHIPNGIEVVRARLQGADGARRFFVAEHLTEPAHTGTFPRGKVGIHGSFSGYRYPDNKPGSDEPVKDGIHDHPSDAVRYYAVVRHGVFERGALDFSKANAALADVPTVWSAMGSTSPSEWGTSEWDGNG